MIVQPIFMQVTTFWGGRTTDFNTAIHCRRIFTQQVTLRVYTAFPKSKSA